MIVYLARDIPAFVMYCVNGESGSSLLIESLDSMIYKYVSRTGKRYISVQKLKIELLASKETPKLVLSNTANVALVAAFVFAT